MTVQALIGLGGNIGEPPAAMRAALRSLDQRSDTDVLAVSRLFRTPPWGKTDQPDFINAAARIRTSLQPRALLEACLDVERILKRERAERWGPRTIDLDLLDVGGRAHRDEVLTLPHPRIAERAFVLVPLADVAPDFTIEGVSLLDVLARIDSAGIEPITADGAWWR